MYKERTSYMLPIYDATKTQKYGRWLQPVILTNWEAEICGCGSRIAWAKSSQDPISTNDLVYWHAPAIPATWERTNRNIVVQASPV
jgi:hypothetical protein